MRILAFLWIFSIVYLPIQAQAGTSKYFFNTFWGSDHWEHQNFQPYQRGAAAQQNISYMQDDWKPEHWINGTGGAKAVIDNFFHHGVLVEQDENCEGIPVLEVGESFLQLSSQEKIRIAKFVDYAYNVTSATNSGMYYLTYRDDDNVIGVYTKHGLQLH